MKKLSILLIVILFSSCAGGKYTYYFDTGKQLDFKKGKWILNRSKSNSEIFDTELYRNSRADFEKILGDSLFEINDLRITKLISPKIKYNLSNSDLKKLKINTGCDFIINIKGTVIIDGAGSFSYSNQNENSSNRASVSISIYDLNGGTLISSSQVYGKTENQASDFDTSYNAPVVNPSSHMIMLKGAKKLIRKYKKNQLK